MSGSIKKSIAVSTALLLFLFVIIGFGASYIAIRHIDSRYQDASVQAALDFAELTIDADAAKECFSTRNRTEDYFTVQNKISEYQKNNSSIISRQQFLRIFHIRFIRRGARFKARLQRSDLRFQG